MDKNFFLVLVDDDEATNIYNEVIIQDSGFVNKYRIFSSALDLLLFFKDPEHLPNAILIDINMPKINGWELVEKLSELISDQQYSPKIYMLSTSMSPKDKEMVEHYQLVQGYFCKPLTEECLEILTKDTATEAA